MTSAPTPPKVDQLDYMVPDGFVLPLPNGGSTVLDSAGTTVNLSALRGVGILDISQVQSHAIHTIAGSRSHVIHFLNGGILQYAYNNTGDVIELSAKKLRLRITPEGDVICYFDFE